MISLVAERIHKVLRENMPQFADAVSFTVEHTKNTAHGDVATNIAMLLAKHVKKAPSIIADELVAHLTQDALFERVEVAGPGFINFFIKPEYYQAMLANVLQNTEQLIPQMGNGQRVLIEYVSANPTGPLHVGHGRGAAYGSALARILQAVGYTVTQEYYLNDAGRQMHILTMSVWLRYAARAGITIPFPEKAYQGAYITEIAQALWDAHNDALAIAAGLFVVPDNVSDPELCLSEYLDVFEHVVPSAIRKIVAEYTLHSIQRGIVDDLADFQVQYDNWFSEQSLFDDNIVERTLETLQANHAIYEKEGALWFEATKWGDEKDRVFQRSNGVFTYFAADLAYHWYKFQQSYDLIIDIFGADHHGYLPRLQAGIEALGCDISRFDVQLVQFAVLYRGKEKVSMSTRSGAFVTLAELCAEVGVDASRFFYLQSKPKQHMDFDLELAKAHSNENPVYYVQYAHARISRVLQKCTERYGVLDADYIAPYLSMLDAPQEMLLLRLLSQYSEVIAGAAKQKAPHILVHYLLDLAGSFHSYYNAVPFLVEDKALGMSRFALLQALRHIFHEGLTLLGVSAPERM